MRLVVTLERDETGMVVAECPAIPGCVSQGRTEDEAIANIREAIAACVEARAAMSFSSGPGPSRACPCPSIPSWHPVRCGR
jgi:predicted RNase H-like HicB family nuclease